MTRIATDAGGTFTDLVAFDEKTGTILVGKALTTPRDPSIGVVETIRQAAEAGLEASSIAIMINDVMRVVNFPLAFAIATAVVAFMSAIVLVGDRRLLSALTESIVVGLATAVVATPIGLSAALAFRAMGARRGAFFLFVLFAMFVPGTIQGLGLSVIFKVIAVKPSWITVTVGHVLWALPFAFTVSLVSLAVVRPNMIAAARDLGASSWRAFRDVTLPLVRGGVISSFVFSFLLSFNEYARAYYLVGRQNTLPLAMFGAMNSGASPTIYALSGAILVISFGLVGILLVAGRRGFAR